MHSKVYTPISFKDQIYSQKLQQLKAKLQSLADRTHPDFLRAKVFVEQDLENRLFCNEVSYKIVKRKIAGDYEAAKNAALKDFEEKKAEMKECLLNELEERKRQIEHEYASCDLNGDGSDIKQAPKRNLRRRNDAGPCGGGSGAVSNGSSSNFNGNDKRPRKTSPIVNVSLNETDIENDLRRINQFSSSSTETATTTLAEKATTTLKEKATTTPKEKTPPSATTTPDPYNGKFDDVDDSSDGETSNDDDDNGKNTASSNVAAERKSPVKKENFQDEFSTPRASSTSFPTTTTTRTILDLDDGDPSAANCGKKMTPVDGKTPSRKTSAANLERNLSTSTTNQSQNSKISQTKISKTTNKQVYQSKGKLYYHKKLYLRGQCVILTTPDMGKMQAVIFSIGPKEIGFKINQEKVETKKISIPVQHLQQGKCTLKHKIT